MAKAASRVSFQTTLVVGQVEIPVGMFATKDKPGKLVEFVTAGPNGGRLLARSVARPEAHGDQERYEEPLGGSDPLAVGPDPAYFEDTPGAWAVAVEALNAARAADAPTKALAAREALAAEAEGDARSRGLTEPALTVGKMGPTVDLRTGERIPDDDPRAQSMATFAEAVSAGAVVESVPAEYGRELYEEGTGVTVAPGDVRRGVRRVDGSFVDCTEQLAAIERETAIDRAQVVDFVPVAQVERARVVGSYYVGSVAPGAAKALRLLYEAMRSTRRCAVVKVTKRTRQSLGVVGWLGKTLVFYELVWAEDLRPAPRQALAIQQVAVSEREVEAAVALVAAMSGSARVLEGLRDDAITRREALYERALRGEVDADVADESARAEDDVLMAQLAASLAAVA